MRSTIAAALATAVALGLAATAGAEPSVPARDGWRIVETDHGFDALSDRLFKAIKAAEMLRVYTASASKAAARRGIDVPGNRVVGVYRNDYAVRMLAASVAAGIEAPIEFYVTEDADGGATLSWKAPSHLFAPYFETATPDLRALAEELDAVFEAIAADAVGD